MFERLGKGPHYSDPQRDVAFGDVFQAEFLLDIFARADTALMGGGPLAAHLARKVGLWMNSRLDQQDIHLYSPAFAPRPQTRFALAHASFVPDAPTRRAILISDSCLTATALAQGRQRRSVGGRLLYAPLRSVSEEEWRGLVESEDFERFPLPDDERLPAGAVAEFGNCFMVDARDVKKHAGSRVASLRRPLAEELDVHWSAYATRRGPRAYDRNTLKLAWLLSGGAQPSSEAERATNAVAEALDLAFRLEGSDLEDVSEAEESVRLAAGNPDKLTPPLIDQMIEHLRQLADRATDAADQLTALRASAHL